MSDYRRPQIQLAAVSALFWLCEDNANRLECARFNGFQRMLGLMADLDQPQIGIIAAQVLSKCCESLENRKWMRECASVAMLKPADENGVKQHDGLDQLLEILGGKVAPEVIRAALNCL